MDPSKYVYYTQTDAEFTRQFFIDTGVIPSPSVTEAPPEELRRREAARYGFAEYIEAETLMVCPRCAAVVAANDVDQHMDWHTELLDPLQAD